MRTRIFVYILAPHHIDDDRIERLRQSYKKRSVRYSGSSADPDASLMILDTIGILTKVYSYADIAYVGGAFDKEGVHNVLEPAVFGIPIVIGPIFDKFIEAVELTDVGGCVAVPSAEAMVEKLTAISSNLLEQKKMGELSAAYLEEKRVPP